MKKHIAHKLSALVLAVMLLATMGLSAAAEGYHVGHIEGSTWIASDAPSGTTSANRMLTAVLGVGTSEDPSITMDIMDDFKTALATAKANDDSVIKLRISNVSYIPLETLETLASLAASEDMTCQVTADRRDGHLNVQSQLVFDPADATKDVYPFVYNEKLHTATANKMMDKYYSNMLLVATARQEVDYGMEATITVKLNFAKVDQENLFFYSYDKISGKVNKIDTEYVITDLDVPQTGYIQFTTPSYAGDFIITSGELAAY